MNEQVISAELPVCQKPSCERNGFEELQDKTKLSSNIRSGNDGEVKEKEKRLKDFCDIFIRS